MANLTLPANLPQVSSKREPTLSSGSGAGCAGKPSESNRSLPVNGPQSAGCDPGRSFCTRLRASRMRSCMGQRASTLAWIFRSSSHSGSGSTVSGEAPRIVSSLGSPRCARGTLFSTAPSATNFTSKSWSSLRLSRSATKRLSPWFSIHTATSRVSLETQASSGRNMCATYSSSKHSVQPSSTRTVYSKSFLSMVAHAPTTCPNCSSRRPRRRQFSWSRQPFWMKAPVLRTSIMT
mmetsp:Transcript_53065/g.164435  ORF Transcript_53065/g.164435 Transcript_53065/m.164435 type:complete len:235 (+) Transcript_53065:610-1314(+)